MVVTHTSSKKNKYNILSENLDKELLQCSLKESREDMVYLPDLIKKNGISVVIEDYGNAFLRESVAINFIQAAANFNKRNLTLKLESAYRSINEQKQRFTKRFLLMKNKYPEKSNNELLKLANTYTAGILILAAHTAGAAVDVILLDKNRMPLNFGTPYPLGTAKSVTNYPNLQKKIKDNRKILKEGMEKYGFINYPFEYWHYSIGDVYASHIKKQKYAIYGPVNYDLETKTTVFPKETQSFYKFFKTT